MARIVVVRLSEAFEELWGELARSLDVGIALIGEGDALVRAADVAAVVVAAGGAEERALEWLRGHEWSGLPLIVVGVDPSRRTAARVVGRGANDYLALPDDLEILSNALDGAVGRHRATRPQDGVATDPRYRGFAAIVGASPALRAVLERAERTLVGDATTLIVGETGTGKELLARALHGGGRRHAAPFVPVNCAALPATLIESELFGHERGAFTDARAAKPGLFEVAEGGTLFLDEVGTLPLDVQAKLLRVLDDREVRRVGGTRSRAIDVRVIAATNDDLDDAVRAGRFREDLYYRLNVIQHRLPPLRDRGEDVLLIAQHLLTRLSAREGLPCPTMTAEVRGVLLGHHWPGNIRELRNAVERALLLSPPGSLRAAELVPAAQRAATVAVGAPVPFPAPLGVIITAAARATLERCGGNRSAAARQLSISRRRLTRLLHQPAARSSR